MFCTKCGEKLKDEDNFCAKCGKQVERESASEQASRSAEGGKAKYRSLVLKITLGVVVVALLVGGWFGWSAYSSFRDKRKRRARHEEQVNEEELQRQYEKAKAICDSNGWEVAIADFEKRAEIKKLVTPAAEHGNADAQFLLGLCYEAKFFYGDRKVYGDNEDNEDDNEDDNEVGAQAQKKKVTTQGGDDVKDLATAVEWYLKSARAGHRKAQKLIALYYLEGYGVPKDLEESYKWACKAGIPFENRNIQLAEYQSGIALSLEELPRSQLTIDVEAHGVCKIYGQDMSIAQIQQQVKDHFLEHGDFPCLIRADQRVMYRHVGEVMAACLEGQREARHLNTDVPRSSRFFFVARSRVDRDGLSEGPHTTFSARCGGVVLSPDAHEAGEGKDNSIKIQIGPRGQCCLNGCHVSFSRLDEYIKKMSEGSKKATVLVMCSSDASYGSLVRTFDICNKYEMNNLVVLPFDCGPSMRMDSPNVSPIADKAWNTQGVPPTEIAEEEENPQEEPPPPAEDEPPPDLDTLDIQLDTPTVSPVAPPADVAPASKEPVSIKPATVDAMLNIKSTMKLKSVAGTARSTGMRSKFVTSNMYGDQTTERAVMKALRWLKIRQLPDGSWPGVKPAATGLAILTFLAHGETPSSPEFGKTVERGIEFLIGAIKEKNGKTVMEGSDGNEYAFLIGTYALCEAYGMTKNPNVRVAAEKTLLRIIKGMTPAGGWDYKMVSSSRRYNLSYAGWALQAIKAGKMAGIHPDGMDNCIKTAVNFLMNCHFKKGGFGYLAGQAPTGLTATGCLALQLFGKGDSTQVKASLEFMKDWKPTFDKKHMSGGASSQYYSYYAAQCKYQAGMAPSALKINKVRWQDWNAEMKALYPRTIIDDKNKDGTPLTIKDPKGISRQVGHWENVDAHSTRPVMDTCLTALQLMVYYRYLPTTQLKAAEPEKNVEGHSKEKDEIKIEVDI